MSLAEAQVPVAESAEDVFLRQEEISDNPLSLVECPENVCDARLWYTGFSWKVGLLLDLHNDGYYSHDDSLQSHDASYTIVHDLDEYDHDREKLRKWGEWLDRCEACIALQQEKFQRSNGSTNTDADGELANLCQLALEQIDADRQVFDPLARIFLTSSGL
jgi:hypothetical protein